MQGVALVLAPMVVNVAIVFRAAGQPESYLAWAVFAALVVCGVTTALQATRLGRLGAGHLIITGPGPIFIAVCIAALTQGGPALMASLVVVASLVEFALSMWLPALRRIITPVVSGTVIMLIAYTIVPIALDLLDDLPDGTSPGAAPCIAGATLAVATAMALRASGALRLWSPLVGIGAGCAVAAAFGVFDTQNVRDAPWVGIPSGQWHGLDLTPGAEFWALLPVFIVVTLTLAINSVSDGIVVQTTTRPITADPAVCRYGPRGRDHGRELAVRLTQARLVRHRPVREHRRLVLRTVPDGFRIDSDRHRVAHPQSRIHELLPWNFDPASR